MAWKRRGPDSLEGEEHAAKRPALGASLICMKLLLSDEEASCIVGQAGSVLEQIQATTGASLRLSSEEQHYPGTMLRELNIQGSSQQSVLGAAVHALSQISEMVGALTSDGGGLPLSAGSARVKCVVPAKAATGIIGPRGENVKSLKLQTGIQCSIDSTIIPPGAVDDMSEQALSLVGPLAEMHIALSAISARVTELASESWFPVWADRSNAGLVIPGLQLFPDKGKGKGAATDNGISEHGGLQPSLTVSEADGLAVVSQCSMKLLVDHSEAGCLHPADVENATSTQIMLSGTHRVYPGTSLQELNIQGLSEKNVLDAVVACLEQVAENTGSISCGETGVEPGGARVKVVVPIKAAKAVIGVGGATVTSIRHQSGMHVHIEPSAIPPGPPHELTEQLVCLSGPLDGLPVALSLISQQVSQYLGEPWYGAWAANSHAGTVIPGLVLFGDKGKGKKGDAKKGDFGGKGDFASKGWAKGEYGGGGMLGPPSSATGSWAAPPPKVHKSQMAFKLLLPASEASCVLGKGGSTIREIGQNTFTKLSLSNINEFYPGTSLQELRVRGGSVETVLAAVLLTLATISESAGAITGGDSDVGPGEARVKVVIPAGATRIVIGKAGANVQDLRQQSGMFIHVEETVVPPGPPSDLSEQVVCFTGPLKGLQVALPMLAGFVAEVSNEPWFGTWTTCSHAGTLIPGLHLFKNIKGHSKGKGKHVGPPTFADPSAQLGEYGGSMSSFAGGKGKSGAKVPGSTLAVKMLLSHKEAMSIYGEDGSTLAELQARTSTTMRLGELPYPGSDLLELCIRGASIDDVLAAFVQVLDRIMATVGAVTCGEGVVDGGGACLKLVVPAKAAAAVIGVGGQTVKQLRQQCGVRLTVDTNAIACTPDMAEQAVLVSGSFAGINTALQTILTQVSEVSGEHWFEAWTSTSNAGVEIPGLKLFANEKGKGKGKSKDTFGAGACDPFGARAWEPSIGPDQFVPGVMGLG